MLIIMLVVHSLLFGMLTSSVGCSSMKEDQALEGTVQLASEWRAQ
jgi:hypothetical protein